jgi:hypothetical protein
VKAKKVVTGQATVVKTIQSASFMCQKDIAKYPVDQIRVMVMQNIQRANEATFLLGGLLNRVNTEDLWLKWQGLTYPSFGEWCWLALGFHKRKAENLIVLFKTADGLNMSAKQRMAMIKLGWSKAYQLCRVMDKESVDEWLEYAKTASHRDLMAKVQSHLAEKNGVPETDTGDDATPEDVDYNELVMKIKFTDTEAYESVQHALDILSKRTKIENTGKLVNLMAIDYLAHNVKDSDGGMVAELDQMIESIEVAYGVKLQVVEQTAKKKKTA